MCSGVFRCLFDFIGVHKLFLPQISGQFAHAMWQEEGRVMGGGCGGKEELCGHGFVVRWESEK